jgi:hypothetical protein
MELIFKGPEYGVKIINKLASPDILDVSINKDHYNINKLTIKYDKKLGTIFIYHSYDNSDTSYSGRYYNTDYNIKDIKLNGNILILKHSNWSEDEIPSNKTKKITIHLSDKAANKLKELITNIKAL